VIVCHCRAVSDRAIRAAIEGGADERELVERCGAGGHCGECMPAVRRLLAEQRRRNPDPEARRRANA
jgi:bacterioferritin-associated ferredoxin